MTYENMLSKWLPKIWFTTLLRCIENQWKTEMCEGWTKIYGGRTEMCGGWTEIYGGWIKMYYA